MSCGWSLLDRKSWGIPDLFDWHYGYSSPRFNTVTLHKALIRAAKAKQKRAASRRLRPGENVSDSKLRRSEIFVARRIQKVFLLLFGGAASTAGMHPTVHQPSPRTVKWSPKAAPPKNKENRWGAFATNMSPLRGYHENT